MGIWRFIIAIMFLGSFAVASTTGDTLGLESVWTTLSEWLNNPYIMRVIAFMMLVTAIMFLAKQAYTFGILMLVLTIVVSKLTTITEAVYSATL